MSWERIKKELIWPSARFLALSIVIFWVGYIFTIGAIHAMKHSNIQVAVAIQGEEVER